MNRGLLALALVTAALGPAAAAPSSILVLQTEGRADPGTRAQVDAALLRLAGNVTTQVSPGDITFADAAAAVGCMPEVPACKVEVIGMLAVDEVVYATVTPTPDGLDIRVHRIGPGGSTREARMTIAPGQPADELPGIAPLFGGAPVASDPSPPPTDPAAPSPPEPGPPPPAFDPAAAPVVSTAPPPPHTGPTDLTRPRLSRRPVIGMVGGGTMVIIGFMLWGQAADVRDQIDAAPTSTLPQLQALAELEARGDSYAGWGNLMFLGGAVLGGISTYYFLQDRKRTRARSARITPTVFAHGAGLALTFGDSP